MAAQTFNTGDWVMVAKGASLFSEEEREAIVIGSYADQYGGASRNTYTLHVKGDSGASSWYDEPYLTLIEHDRTDKLRQWKAEAQAVREQESDLDWVFTNGHAVIDSPSGHSVQALADCFGLTNLWGSRGEGITYFHNSVATMEMARHYLMAGDKAGWLAHCKNIIANRGL
jgi:hypothetical protein